MLAVIAAAGERGVSRERIASLFWPDSDEERARQSVRQVLYALRQGLGRDVVTTVRSTLQLDPAAISSDIGDFRAALTSGHRERAVSIARGPFLDGFYLPGVADFERWLEEERSRLTTTILTITLSLATDASRLNDRDAAVEWWRQLTTLDPLSGRFAVGYLKALAARGDRAEALAFARQHELVIRRELETDPDPDVRRLEAELRAIPGPEISVATNGRTTSPKPAEGSPPAVASSLPDVTPVSRWKMLRRSLVAAVLVLAIAGVTRAAILVNRADEVRPTFAVGLVHEDAIADSLRMGHVLTDMIATNLARVEGLRVLSNSRLLELLRPGSVDSSAAYYEAARRAGATELLEGQLLTVAGTPTLELQRVELSTGLVQGVYRVRAADRYALVDSVTRAISDAFRLRDHVGPVASATTNSLVAYRLYEEGVRAYYQGDIKSARRLVRSALVEDSTFAMAAYYEAQLTGNFDRTSDGRSGIEVTATALRLAEKAPERERLTITTNLLVSQNDPRSLVAAESLATRYPDDPRVLITVAKVHATHGDWAKAVGPAERAIVLDSIADTGSPVCQLCDDYWTLFHVYLWWDSTAAAERVARRFEASRPNLMHAYHLQALLSARHGDSTSADTMYQKRAAITGIDPAFRIRLDLMLERYDIVERDARPLLASKSEGDRGEGFWNYFMALRNQGRLHEAAALATDGWFAGLPPLGVKHVRSAIHEAIVAMDNGDPQSAAALFGQASVPDEKFPPGFRARDLAWRGARVGMALAAAGDLPGVASMADSVEAWGRQSVYGRDPILHHYLRGLIHAAAGRHAQAVREYRAAMYSQSLGFTRVNYELAGSLLALKRPRDAVATLQASLRGDPDASNLYISKTELHERLAEAFDQAGNRDSAAVHYRAVVAAWKRADPLYQPRRDRAAAWLTRFAKPTVTDER